MRETSELLCRLPIDYIKVKAPNYRIAAPERVWRDSPGDASGLRRFGYGNPRDLRGDGQVGPPVVLHARKEIALRLHPAPVLAQNREQLRAQRNIAVASTLAS